MSNRMNRPDRCGPSLTHITRAVVSITTPWVAMRASMARRSPRGKTAHRGHAYRAARRSDLRRRALGKRAKAPRRGCGARGCWFRSLT